MTAAKGKKRKAPVASQNVSAAREYLSPSVCPRCRAMVGLAVCDAWVERVDLVALSMTDEAWSIARGRWTFELRGYGSTKYLKRRNRIMVFKHSFQSKYPVLGEHECEGTT